MLELDKRKNIDLLVEQFWKHGYMSISRRYGRYLPEPEKIGNFEIDVIARCEKEYAIGITISGEDLKDPMFLEKIAYLATRQTKFSNKKVLLFVGIPASVFKKAKALLENIDSSTKNNMRVFQIAQKGIIKNKKSKRRDYFFS